MEEDRIYKKAGMSWQVYSASGTGATRSRIYTKIDKPSRELQSSANYLASVCPRNTKFTIECYTSWAVSDIDNDPLSHDLTMGRFIPLEVAFSDISSL